jgi:NADPH-dependent curcumin reductase CurA
VASDAAPLRPLPEIAGVSPTAHLGVLGGTGLTAWVGLTDIGRPQPGETVVVPAAAGAVGSVAGQIAKLRGARVVGIAGGPEKRRLLAERLGFDAAIDRRAADWREQLVAATPDGIDVDFETVGGEIMDAILARLNLRARVVLCGLISSYNAPEPPPGPRNLPRLLIQGALLQGFIVLDHLDRLDGAEHPVPSGHPIRPRRSRCRESRGLGWRVWSARRDGCAPAHRTVARRAAGRCAGARGARRR